MGNVFWFSHYIDVIYTFWIFEWTSIQYCPFRYGFQPFTIWSALYVLHKILLHARGGGVGMGFNNYKSKLRNGTEYTKGVRKYIVGIMTSRLTVHFKRTEIVVGATVCRVRHVLHHSDDHRWQTCGCCCCCTNSNSVVSATHVATVMVKGAVCQGTCW